MDYDASAFPPARAAGRLAAVAGDCQRDLQRCALTYRDLFPSGSFDPGLFSTVALANVYSAPWLTADGLRLTNRASLWAFGVDRLIDAVADSAAAVEGVVDRCVRVAAGAPARAGDELTGFLAAITAEVRASPGYAWCGEHWQAALRGMLEAMAREWHWARHWPRETLRPSLAEYVDNADNFGFGFVFATFLVTTAVHPLPPARVDALLDAARAAQRVMRLANDLATVDRDLASGDLNVLMFGEPVDAVHERIARLTDHGREMIAALRAEHPHACAYVERELDYNLGFYSLGDYWPRS
jgi:hypothetical protein